MVMFKMRYPMNAISKWITKYIIGSIPQFTTQGENYVASLACIWEVVHSDDSWIDVSFYVDGKLFQTRAEFRDFYKLKHKLHMGGGVK